MAPGSQDGNNDAGCESYGAKDPIQVGSDVAVPMVLPLTGERATAVTWSEHPFRRQVGQNACNVIIEDFGESTLLLAPVIPPDD